MAAEHGELQGPPGAQERQRIAVFLRLRPVPRASGRVVTSAEEGWVEFSVPRDASQGLVNNSRESYRFPFDGLLPPEARQDEVFERVAAPVLHSALDGYNGTVFAFGQTGSGKTFTISGGTERYADRGLIPRSISAAFAEAARRTDHAFTLHVSYMEIYCETGYDLLEPNREVKALEDLPKVRIMEEEGGRLHIRNLSMHRCDTEEQALNMLFLGDTNRVVAETPLNQASSRSHCIFTLHIEARRAGEALVRRSKLHFVDLAGSERVVKTGLAAHAQLKEAKYINLSLHFLEQVINSLQEGRTHVPYRNSMLTQVLRDSLGGNTRTIMVAAVAPAAQHIEESISTCRFAQRVAMITNRVEVNEEMDLELVVKRLKQENTLLRQEIALLRSGGATAGSMDGGGSSDSGAGAGLESCGAEQRHVLSEEEEQALRRQVLLFVEDPAADATLDVQPSMLFIHAAFALLKSMVRGGDLGAQQPAASGGGGQAATAPAAELRSLRHLVQEQEQQIVVLTGMLRKQGQGPATAARTLHQASSGPNGPAIDRQSSSGSLAALSVERRASQNGVGGSWSTSDARADQSGGKHEGSGSLSAAPLNGGRPANIPGVPHAFSDELLTDQHKAFKYFCATSPAHDAVAEHKAVLRGKYEEARALGSRVAASKQQVGELKAAVEQRRLARSMAALLRQKAGGGGSEGMEEGLERDAEEERIKGMIEKEKAAYRQAYEALRGVKAEVDGVESLLQRSRVRLQRDFQSWYAAMVRTGGGEQGAGAVTVVEEASHAGLGAVWRQQGAARLGEGVAVAAAQEGPPLRRGKSAGRQQDAASLQKGLALAKQQQPPPNLQQLGWSVPAALSVGQRLAPSLPHGSNRQKAESGPSPAAVLPSFNSWQAAPSFRSDQQHLQGGTTNLSSPATTPRQAASTALGPIEGRELQQQRPEPLKVAQPPLQIQQYLPPPQQQQQADAPPDPSAGVEPDVLAAARPLLTGNAQADSEIIKFYQARHALLKSMRQG